MDHTYFLLLARGNLLLYILLLVMALEICSSFLKKKIPGTIGGNELLSFHMNRKRMLGLYQLLTLQ